MAQAALEPADWVHKTIGVSINEDSYSKLSPQELAAFKAASSDAGRKVQTRNGLVVELNATGLGSELVFHPKAGSPVTIWKTAMENCFGLIPSPDENFVAYLCASNGLFITRLP